ncbi:hypothetical protein B0H13DRAFT_2417519 [Mycena leptocephala]|nr:hypothetical protein B0H13DRAFT_2417519 [Mycena leptocephala]
MSTNTSTALIHLDQRAHELQMQLVCGSLSDPAAGRTLNQVYSHVGDYLGRKVNRAAYRWGRGPSATADRIAAFFGTGSQREANLDTLLVDSYPRLEDECSRLLKYALPLVKLISIKVLVRLKIRRCETAQTQVATFKCIVTIATRYHGTRGLLLKSKYLRCAGNTEALISAVWARADDTQPHEWDYYCQFAAACLSEKEISPILGNISPRCLGSINGDFSVIERLLVASESSANSISDALAQRYLAGVLELPTFWQESGVIHVTVFTKILDRIICVLNDLGVDSDEDSDEDKSGIIFDQEGIDSMASAILIGVLDWHTEDPKTQYWYRNLTEIVRPRAERLLPASATLATGPGIKHIITDTTPETLDVLTRAPNKISQTHADREHQPSEHRRLGKRFRSGPGFCAPRVVYTKATISLRWTTLGGSLRRWYSGLYKLGSGHRRNKLTSSTKRPKWIPGWLRALLSRNNPQEFVPSSEAPTEDISAHDNSIPEPEPGSSVECDEDEPGGEDSESQADSDGISIQPSRANESEDEHSFMSQLPPSLPPNNMTNEALISSSGSNWDHRPWRRSITLLNNYLQAKQASHTLSWAESSAGPAYEIKWTVVCKVSGEAKGIGVADSKAAAKEEAARQALVALGVST